MGRAPKNEIIVEMKLFCAFIGFAWAGDSSGDAASLDCFTDNGGCSHFCSPDACFCPPCWTLDADELTCVPDPNHVTTSCGPSGMSIDVDECVYNGDTMTLTLNDNTCQASMMNGSDGSVHYSADHGLDECGTTISDVNGNIVFTNNLNVASRVNERGITMVTDVNMSYTCTFPRVVDVTDYATITNRAAQAGTAATGVFSFDLEYFTDASFSMVSTDDDDKIVGETVFFQIVPSEAPVNGLAFTTTTCTITDEALGQSFDVISDQCPNVTPLNGVQITGQVSANFQPYQFSYRAFQFNQASDLSTMDITCSIEVCPNGEGLCAGTAC